MRAVGGLSSENNQLLIYLQYPSVPADLRSHQSSIVKIFSTATGTSLDCKPTSVFFHVINTQTKLEPRGRPPRTMRIEFHFSRDSHLANARLRVPQDEKCRTSHFFLPMRFYLATIFPTKQHTRPQNSEPDFRNNIHLTLRLRRTK